MFAEAKVGFPLLDLAINECRQSPTYLHPEPTLTQNNKYNKDGTKKQCLFINCKVERQLSEDGEQKEPVKMMPK